MPRINIFMFPLNIGKLTGKKNFSGKGSPVSQPFSDISGQMHIGCGGRHFIGIEV